MANHPHCDLCGNPATHFFADARSAIDGNLPPGPVSTGTSLCDKHAREYEAASVHLMIEDLRHALAASAKLALLPESITLYFAADDDASCDRLRVKLREKCEPSVKPASGHSREAFDISAVLPVPPDVIRNEWFDWISATARLLGCRFSGWQIPHE